MIGNALRFFFVRFLVFSATLCVYSLNPWIFYRRHRSFGTLRSNKKGWTKIFFWEKAVIFAFLKAKLQTKYNRRDKIVRCYEKKLVSEVWHMNSMWYMTRFLGKWPKSHFWAENRLKQGKIRFFHVWARLLKLNTQNEPFRVVSDFEGDF